MTRDRPASGVRPSAFIEEAVMQVRLCRVRGSAWALAGLLLIGPASVRAQVEPTVSGRLLNSLSGDPIAEAVVLLDELRRETKSDASGAFAFAGVPPGDYHVSVRADGYSSRRTEVRVAVGAVPLELLVDPELHFEEVLSVGAEARSEERRVGKRSGAERVGAA